jgi:hypothetical protein
MADLLVRGAFSGTVVMITFFSEPDKAGFYLIQGQKRDRGLRGQQNLPPSGTPVDLFRKR